MKQTSQTSQKIQSLDGPPLDFSFKNFRSLKELLSDLSSKNVEQLEPLEKTGVSFENKEEKAQKVNSSSSNGNGHQEDAEKSENSNEYESSKLQIVRTIEVSEAKILDMNKNASKKRETQQKKQVRVIESKPSAIFLRYNKLTSVEGLHPTVLQLFPCLENLLWIDLSHNRLTTLVEDFQRFPNLKNLYLHVNYISNFQQMEKLQKVELLKSLTIHANPLEDFSEFRVLISNILPQLQKIDSTLLTKRERDRGQILRQQIKKYPKVKSSLPKHESDNEEEK